MKDYNSKEMKYYLDKICGNPKSKVSSNVSMRDMLKITRNLLNEDINDQNSQFANPELEPENNNAEAINKETVYDQTNEEEKFKALFDDMKVSIKFGDLKVTDDYVMWSITVNNAIQFIYAVTREGLDTPVEIKPWVENNPDNQEINDEIVKRGKAYDDVFFKYWTNELGW